MKNAKLTVIAFNDNDVIATSGVILSVINTAAQNDLEITFNGTTYKQDDTYFQSLYDALAKLPQLAGTQVERITLVPKGSPFTLQEVVSFDSMTARTTDEMFGSAFTGTYTLTEDGYGGYYFQINTTN